MTDSTTTGNDVANSEESSPSLPPECFVIMPIAEQDGYPNNHFRHVYTDIIKPACEKSGVRPVRADDVKQTNLIHVEILRRLIHAPLAICDLSSRNPNVLFELGIRQAFDKPVVLIQERGTPSIFDIGPIRYMEYSREMRYHEVLSTQEELSLTIRETLRATEDSGSINSIVKLIGLSEAAKIPEIRGDRESIEFQLLRNEISGLRRAIKQISPSSVPGRMELIEHFGTIMSPDIVGKSISSILKDESSSDQEKYNKIQDHLLNVEAMKRVLPAGWVSDEMTAVEATLNRLLRKLGRKDDELLV